MHTHTLKKKELEKHRYQKKMTVREGQAGNAYELAKKERKKKK